MTFQWLRGSTIVGTGRTLELADVSAADAGNYRVIVTNALGATTSAAASLALDGSPALTNLSIRATTGPGERTLITGFVVRGPNGLAPKSVVIRGIGPGLTSFGVPTALPGPALILVDSANCTLAHNTRWDATVTPANLFARVGAFPLAAGSADSALQAALTPGSYTAVLTDTAARTGNALIELYEADATTTRVVTLSARAYIGPGADLGIAGFTVRGAKPARYLIRGIGPTLASFGLTAALAAPVLTLTTATGAPIATNTRWNNAPNAAEIATAATQVGAFPLPANSADAVLLMALTPGTYTAQLTGAAGTSGIALLEIYELP
jgi:hypothetical protein